MPFKLGNQEAKKANRGRARIIRQQLIAGLHEIDPKDPEGATHLDKLVSKLVQLALGGDITAIRLIFDRVEGKAPREGAADVDEKRERTDWSREELMAFLNEAHAANSFRGSGRG